MGQVGQGVSGTVSCINQSWKRRANKAGMGLVIEGYIDPCEPEFDDHITRETPRELRAEH